MGWRRNTRKGSGRRGCARANSMATVTGAAGARRGPSASQSPRTRSSSLAGRRSRPGSSWRVMRAAPSRRCRARQPRGRHAGHGSRSGSASPPSRPGCRARRRSRRATDPGSAGGLGPPAAPPRGAGTALQLVAVGDEAVLVGRRGQVVVVGQEADRRPAPLPTRLGRTGPEDEAVRPRLEPVRVAQAWAAGSRW